MKNTQTVLSGMRPTGKLHIGHWVGALSNWVRLQTEYQCFFMVADWHALMSEYKAPGLIPENILDNVADWIACGLNPEKSHIFVQSDVPEHLELFAILSTLVPLGWLYRCPTFKEQITQLADKDINTYSFLGYPILQAADILLYKAQHVPVGEDQLPHLELTREIVRRCSFLYGCDIFVEPQPLLTKTPRLPGLDGRKMSKSFGNTINLDDTESCITKKITSMITDPARIKKTDPGHPDICAVYEYHQTFNAQRAPEVRDWCTNAQRGCVECKKILAASLHALINPLREKKEHLRAHPDTLKDILKTGKTRAQKTAAETITEIKKVLYTKKQLS